VVRDGDELFALMIFLTSKKIAKPFFSSCEYFSAGSKLQEENASAIF